jgi:hypothetical protein
VKDPTEDNDPLVPDRDDWEDRVAELLRGDDVDTDLGRRMARDAIRVSRGELSDKEFQERYSDEVQEIFGTSAWTPAQNDSKTDTETSNAKNGDSEGSSSDSA